MNNLLKYYKISMELEENQYCVLAIDWNCDNEYVEISMPTYIPKSLKHFSSLTKTIHAVQPTNGQCHNTTKSISI